jgi:hypothetical protein
MQIYGTALIAWNTQSDADLDGWRIYYGTASGNYSLGYVDVGLTASTGSPSYTLTGLRDQHRVYAAVTAYDTANNESTFIAEVSKMITLPLVSIRRTFP